MHAHGHEQWAAGMVVQKRPCALGMHMLKKAIFCELHSHLVTDVLFCYCLNIVNESVVYLSISFFNCILKKCKFTNLFQK